MSFYNSLCHFGGFTKCGEYMMNFPRLPEERRPQIRFNMMLIRVNRTLLSPLAQTSHVSAKDSDNSVSIGNLIDPFALTL